MHNSVEDQRPVVVGVDQSASAHDAALWAAELAAVWRVPLRLCHAVSGGGAAWSRSGPEWFEALAASARAAGAEQVQERVVYGDPTDQLDAQARDAQLLVLGSYGERGWSGSLVGTIALGLIERCDCPVVAARGFSPGLPPPRSGPVVVGVDGTAASTDALRFAAGLTTRTQHRRMIAVHTWSDVVSDASGYVYRLTENPDKLATQAHELLDRSLAPVLADHPDLTIERDVRQDTPLRALLEHARHAWLVVVGQRGTPSAWGMRAGSTSRGLVEFASCPVAVVAPRNPTGYRDRT